jgi:hypothetical protein
MELFTGGHRGSISGSLTLVAGVVSLVAVFATRADGASPSPSPIPQGCRLHAPQPEAPLKLNVVAARGVAKTIAMEKEVFDCYNERSTLQQIKDVETFIELVDHPASGKKQTAAGRKANPKPAPTVSVTAVTCTKALANGRISCKTAAVPLGVTSAPLAGCSPMHGTYPFGPVEQPSHPVEMSTVFVRGLAKNVKVEKEVFDCGGRIGDVYVFTTRTASLAGGAFGRAATRFFGVICLKDEAKALVAVCKLFAP